MPCTRSMARSVSTKGRGGEDEMPPPAASTLPKTRTTRSKKPTRYAEYDYDEEERITKSPVASVSSAKSTQVKTKTRSKAAIVEEPVSVSKTSRPTRKKQLPSISDVTKTVKQLPVEKSARKDDAMLVLKSVGKALETKVTAKKQKQKPAATSVVGSKAASSVKRLRGRKGNTCSEETTTDDEIGAEQEPQKKKNLTSEQLVKGYANPITTALSVGICDVYSKFIEKIMDTESSARMEKAFQQLINSPEMPPPPPKTKGKGRNKKRARSPEPTPNRTNVPASFNFAENKQDVQLPAKKKMILDGPSSGEFVNEADNSERNLENKKKLAKESVLIHKTTLNDKVEESTKDDNEYEVSNKGLLVKVAPSKENPPVIGKTTENEEKKKAQVRPEEKNVQDNSAEINTKVDLDIPKKCSISRNHVENNGKQTKDPKSIVCPEVSLPNKTGTDTSDSQDANEIVNSNKGVALDQTFVFETPNDDKNGKDVKMNITFTPELFPTDTPKSSRSKLNETVDIFDDSICEQETNNKDKILILAPPSPECANGNTPNGIVSSLVTFFDKKTNDKALNGKREENVEKTRSTSPDFVDTPINPNSTYVLPSAQKESKDNPSSMLNVTVCVKKAPLGDEWASNETSAPIPILPPAQLQETRNQESAASRTFVMEPPNLEVVVEEDEGKDERASGKSDKLRALIKIPSKEVNKGASTSSSSSCSSMKSAVSQPCLTSKHKLGVGASKNGPSYGSAGKLHDASKSKPLEDAEKRKQELLKLKVDQIKKKNDESKKKIEKLKIEEGKKLKEKQKNIQTSSGINLKKPVPLALPKSNTGSGLVTAYSKPKPNFVPTGLKFPNPTMNVMPPLPKLPYHKPVPGFTSECDADESFKTANSSNLDATVDGHLSSYDITVYEDLDEDLKHRENKTVPNWASDKESLKEALFSMVLVSEYQFKLPSAFPRPDKNFKLFPNRIVHH